jgi:transposase
MSKVERQTRPQTDNRRFLNALLSIARSGARWRDLPEELGDSATVKRRYYRWIEMRVLDAILAAFARDACAKAMSLRFPGDLIRRTDCRAHRRWRGFWCSGLRETGQGPGRSTPFLAPCPGGMLMRPNDGRINHQPLEMIQGFVADVTIADKGYDADHLCERIAQPGGEVVIPPKRNRSFRRPYDAELYKALSPLIRAALRGPWRRSPAKSKGPSSFCARMTGAPRLC